MLHPILLLLLTVTLLLPFQALGGSSSPFTPLGCYTDCTNGEVFAHSHGLLLNISTQLMSREACALFAYANGQSVFGLQNGYACFVFSPSSLADAQNQGTSTECTVPCSGGSGTCGGVCANDLFNLTSSALPSVAPPQPAQYLGCYSDCGAGSG